MKDLEAMKKILQAELIDVKKRIEALKEDDPFNDPDYSTNNAAVDTDVREQEAHQRIEAEIENLEIRVHNIHDAMERIAHGNYGTCKRCNQTIPEKRLELIPESIYCVTCESELKQ